MRELLPSRLQIAGIETPHLPYGPVYLPKQVELGSDGGEDWLVWTMPPDADGCSLHEGLQRGVRCLDAFIKLATAQPTQVLDFARKWGVLMLCEHRLPFSHPRYPALPVTTQPMAPSSGWVAQSCYPLGTYETQGQGGWERVADWCHYARWARAILSVAASIHQGKHGQPADWQIIFPAPTPGQDLFKPSGGNPLDDERVKLMLALESWVDWGGVQPRLYWPEGKEAPEVRLKGSGLFGLLATQLTFSVAKARSLDFCKFCGAVFAPRRSDQLYCSTTCRESHHYNNSPKSPKNKPGKRAERRKADNA